MISLFKAAHRDGLRASLTGAETFRARISLWYTRGLLLTKSHLSDSFWTEFLVQLFNLTFPDRLSLLSVAGKLAQRRGGEDNSWGVPPL